MIMNCKYSPSSCLSKLIRQEAVVPYLKALPVDCPQQAKEIKLNVTYHRWSMSRFEHGMSDYDIRAVAQT
jgi:hypothetical protein